MISSSRNINSAPLPETNYNFWTNNVEKGEQLFSIVAQNSDGLRNISSVSNFIKFITTKNILVNDRSD